jgi:hypothetical protein
VKDGLANHEIVTLAVFLLGGETNTIDTEDIAIKANEIAPGRFSWRKYPEQINIENVRTFLSDAKKAKNGSFLLGSGKEGWSLTESGLIFAQDHITKLKESDQSRIPLKPDERRWRNNEAARMFASEAYSKYVVSGLDSISLKEAESFFRLDDYVTGKAREKKITRYINAFNDNPEIGELIISLAKKIRVGSNQ